MHINVEIPVKSYLIKFIAKSHDVDPFVVTTGKCHFSALILDPIKKDYYRVTLKEERSKYEILKVMVPLGENKFTIDQETVLRINQRLQSMFNQQLIDMVTMTNEKKGDIFGRVAQFTEYYNITDDDLDFYTVVKMYYRATHPQESKTLIKNEMHRWEQLRLFDQPTGSDPAMPG